MSFLMLTPLVVKMGKWRRVGWLITGRGRILILNRKALEDMESNLLV
jgi:hypothetical protein